MAGIEFNFSNVFMFFSIIPFLLVFFMVMISIFDSIKGFIYIFGLFLAYGLTIIKYFKYENV